MLVYGRNVAKELLENGKDVKKIFLQDNFDDKKIISLMEKLKISVEIKPKREMDHLCNGLHQGIILDIRDYQYSKLDDVLNKNPNFVVILDHLEDPHNFGAIIRTAESIGVKNIIIPKDRSVCVNETVMKCSAGTLNHVNIIQVPNLVNAINYLKDLGFFIYGAVADGINYKKVDYSDKKCLVVGSEGKGISNLVRKNCDEIISLPMRGHINSLNASVAAAILIYEMGD